MTNSNQGFLDTAEFLGAKLVRDAIWDNRRCNWFGLPITESRNTVGVITHSMCGPDYYYGTSGIALFLAHLYGSTGEQIFRLTAEGAIRQALSRLDDIPLNERLSFRRGLVGIAYSLFELAKTCSIEKFNSLGLFILEEACRHSVAQERSPVNFSAIPALLKIYRDHPKDFLLQLAIRLGEQLLSVRGENALGSSVKADVSPLTLIELYRTTADVRFKQAAEEDCRAINNNLLTPNRPAPSHILAVGMIRLRAWETFRNDLDLEEAKSALLTITRTVDQTMFERQVDFSIEQGLAGMADLLIEAGLLLKESHYHAAAEKIGSFGVERYRKDNLPWPCNTPGEVETPGLMNGLAGIGYVYLRLDDYEKVPSVVY